MNSDELTEFNGTMLYYGFGTMHWYVEDEAKQHLIHNLHFTYGCTGQCWDKQ